MSCMLLCEFQIFMVGAERIIFSKFVPPVALKMHSLTLPVLRFLCKTFSKLLKFTLRDTLKKFKKIHIFKKKKKIYVHKLVRASKQSGLKRCSKWYRTNHTNQLKYLHRLMTGSRFVKKSRRKNEHLCDLSFWAPKLPNRYTGLRNGLDTSCFFRSLVRIMLTIIN